MMAWEEMSDEEKADMKKLEETRRKVLARDETFITQLGTGRYDSKLESLHDECSKMIHTILECYVEMFEKKEVPPLAVMAHVIDRIRSEEKILHAIDARLNLCN